MVLGYISVLIVFATVKIGSVYCIALEAGNGSISSLLLPRFPYGHNGILYIYIIRVLLSQAIMPQKEAGTEAATALSEHHRS